MKTRQQLGNSKRWVIKVGSSLVTRDGQGLDHEQIASWVKQICALRQQGHHIVLVSSGSVVEGLVRLGWNKRPEALNDLQAAAAVGQMGLRSKTLFECPQYLKPPAGSGCGTGSQ
jgi:glutamate 5-kinase